MAHDLRSLTRFVKEAAKKVFRTRNDAIANVIHNTIENIITQEDDYEDMGDFEDDLKIGVECYLVTAITAKLEEQNYPWTDSDRDELFQMLYKIYYDKINDISQFNRSKSAHHRSASIINAHNALRTAILSTVNTLNKKAKKKIDTDSVKALLSNNSDWNTDTILNVSASVFCEEAKTYGIKRPLANKLLYRIQSSYKREAWTIGSECKIYSKLKKGWLDGTITNITSDDEGEWLDIKYQAGDQRRTKQVQRNSTLIQPISITSVLSPPPGSLLGDTQHSLSFEEAEEFELAPTQNITTKPPISSVIARISVEMDDEPTMLNEEKSTLEILHEEAEEDDFEEKEEVLSALSTGRHKVHTRSLSHFPTLFIGGGSRRVSSIDENKETLLNDELLKHALNERNTREAWNVDDIIEVYIEDEEEWIGATITGDKDDILQLKQLEDDTQIEIHRMDEYIRPLQKIALLHRNSSNTPSSSLSVAHNTRNPLLEKVGQAIDSINHQIDSSHEFLYQVYHTEVKENEMKTYTYITYEHDKAMKHYRDTIKHKFSTSMLCNGKIMKQYGDIDICAGSTKAAQSDYKVIHATLYSPKLDKKLIIDQWKLKYSKYPQKWLLSAKKEDFVNVAINVFKINNVQNALKLFKTLMRLVNYEDDITKAEEIVDSKEDKTCDDIMFLWTRKNIENAETVKNTKQRKRGNISDAFNLEQIKSQLLKHPEAAKMHMKEDKKQLISLDHIHFLYIVSVILNDLKRGKEFNKVDMKAILRCLHRVQMNGLIFAKIDKDVFTRSVIIYSHSFKEVNLKSLHQLTKCTNKLYDEIKVFDLESIAPSTICNIYLSHGESEKKQDCENDFEHDVLNTFEQWMITFDAQYNRSTSFSLGMFKTLTDKYLRDRKIIINMKYDNYITDLAEKIYDDVLKSFIAWSITLKCGNLRCEEKLKLNCYCDTNTFQLYTYKAIMGLIELKANNNFLLLEQLRDINSKTTVPELCDTFCEETLPKHLIINSEYIEIYKEFICDWINFDFYNFKCIYCHHINKTIMIDRVYQYSKTMDACRICNKKQIQRVRNDQPQFDVEQAVNDKNKDTNQSRSIFYEPSEFNLPSLYRYLTVYGASKTDLDAIGAFVREHEYDSDSIKEDIEFELQSKTDSNISSKISSQCFALMRKYLIYDRYSSFHEGMMARYLVLRPKYFSLLNEICLNDICALEYTSWKMKLLPSVKEEYDKEEETLTSTVTDKRFGIEIGEAIGIHHLCALYLFTNHDAAFVEYRSYFSRSYWLWDKNIYCSNFYWIGRYLYEVVQFYGDALTKHDKANTLWLGLRSMLSFDSVAPIFNAPALLTDNMDIARKFAGTNGSTLQLRPKYIGDIDASKILHVHLFNRDIRLVKGAKLQLQSIQTMKPPKNYQNVVLAMQYIEKILLQTKFDVHFYESQGLYNPIIMKQAYNLIMQTIDHSDTHNEEKKDNDNDVCVLPNYSRDLFNNWCFKRQFVTFETFRLEMHYMDYKLKEFLYDKQRKKVNIVNVSRFLPNLIHYHDINGELRNVKKAIGEEKEKNKYSSNKNSNLSSNVFGLLYNCQDHDIPYHIVNALQDIGYKFNDPTVLRSAFKMELRKLSINYNSFYGKRDEFEKQLISIGIPMEVGTDCIHYIISEKTVHAQTETKSMIKWFLQRLISHFQDTNVKCNLFTKKEAFQKLYHKQLTSFQDAVRKKEKVTIKDLYKVAKNIKIFDAKTAEKINMKNTTIFDEETAKKLSKYLYIKMMDDKQKIVPWECKTCQFSNDTIMVNGLWRHYNEGNECGMCGDPRYVPTNKVKKAHRRKNTMLWQKMAKSSFSIPSKTQEQNQTIDTEEWDQISYEAECTLATEPTNELEFNQFSYLLKNHFIPSFCASAKPKQKEMIEKYQYDIVTYFEENAIDGKKFHETNQKYWVKELKLYCDNKKLTGTLTAFIKNIKNSDPNTIPDVPENAMISVKRAQVLDDLASNQFLYLLQCHFFAEFDKSATQKQKDSLQAHKDKIVLYFKMNQTNGRTFNETNQKKLVTDLKTYCDDKKLAGTLIAFIKMIKQCDLNQFDDIPDADIDDDEKEEDASGYDQYISECPALHRVIIILRDFEAKTKRMSPQYGKYHEMNLYLSCFPGYSPIGFLNDIDHIMQHTLDHPQCTNGKECIHIKRALRDRNDVKCINLNKKKQFFNAINEIEFVYISMLDRAHCLLRHSETMAQRVKTLLNEDVIQSGYIPYSHGVFMEYHTLKPLFQNLFDEVVCNKSLKVTEQQCTSDLEASKLFLQTKEAKKRNACKTDPKYGIKINEPMHIEHILCIKFYCNYSNLCMLFRGSYRKHKEEETNEDIIRRHCDNHYWFGRFLTTAIEFWGDVPSTKGEFFHGLTGKFLFHNFSTVYEIPTSTTWDKNVARQFCNAASGIILKLSPKYTNEVDNSRCLDVSGLSDYAAEKERLFAGMTVLSITDIYNPSDNLWNGYKHWIAAFLYFERITEQTIHQKCYYNFGSLDSKKQRKYLLPLLVSQMKQNECESCPELKRGSKQIPEYIERLFRFFCKNKRDYVDLSCIDDEISSMDICVQNILLKNAKYEGFKLISYKINKTNLRYIFPNLKEYKNHMGYWQHVK